MKKKLFLIVVSLMTSVALWAQNVTISGTVTDSMGPVIGASVLVKGTTNGVATDFDGNYSLTAPKGATVEVASIGYVSQTFVVGDKTKIDIVLEEDSEMIEQTVVVGYGTVNRKNFTGSVATYNVGDSPVSNVSKTNALEMLRGMAPGLAMSQSGVAGSEPSMQVRGQKSISGGSDPLIVLDGVIFKGSINDIDPNTVESMSVMKDATSLASYGSQAANGVIMITSKKGTAGKPTINFKGSVALSQQNYHQELFSGDDYINLINDRNNLPYGSTTWLSDVEMKNYKAGKETDWIDYVSRTGVVQDYSMNISGGSEGMNYLFGVGHSDNKNFLKGNHYIRETITGRFNTTITKWLSAGMNFNWAATQNDGYTANYSRFFSPFGSATFEDGTKNRYITGGNDESALNPMWGVEDGLRDRENRGNNATLGGNIEVKFPWVKGLSYKITGNYTVNNNVIRTFIHEGYYLSPSDKDASSETADKYLASATGSITNSKRVSWVLDNILTYTRELGDHYINATLVYTRDYSKAEASANEGTGFAGLGNTTLSFWGLNNADTQKFTSLTYSLKTDVGYLARVNYSFKNKYHFNASIRRDGSSVFGADHKWGNFPAVGVAYTISDEPWFKSIDKVDYLKLKLSWGKNGNQSLSPYGTLSRVAMGQSGGQTIYFDGNTPTYAEMLSTIGNPNLGWETTTSWNAGFEADMFERLLHWEVDAYKSKTTDQIFSRKIPVMGSGITSQQATMGQVNNWGIESTLRASIIKKRDLNWTSTLTFTMNRNKLVELYGDGEDDITNQLFLGKSLGAIYGYKYIGVVQATDTDYIAANGSVPGDPMYANLDGSEDGRITANDRTILGYNKEAFRMSWSNTVSYKNLSLYVMFNGSFSGGDYGVANNFPGQNMQYINTVKYDYWNERNTDAKYPRAYASATMLEKYGFVRLQDVQLSYNFKAPWMQKAKIGSLQAYVSGKNLFFIAPNWEFSDPEVRSPYSQQLMRTYTFGVNVRF